MRAGKEEQRVRDRVLGRKRETEMIKREVSKEQSDVYASSLTFNIYEMLSSNKSSRGIQENRDEI